MPEIQPTEQIPAAIAEGSDPVPYPVDSFPDSQVQDHLATLPNAMTLARPLALGPLAAMMLVRSERGVTPVVVAMAATDAEGKVARAIDRHSIEQTGERNGYGTTELGKSIDPIGDTLGFLEVAGAALKSPRVSKLGKLAVGIVLVQEGVKSAWAVRADKEHKKQTGEPLIIDVDPQGKIATGEKFAALTGAVLTHDLEPGKVRTAAGLAAVGAAVRGARRGERVRRGYNADLKAQGVDVHLLPRLRRSKKTS